MKSATGLLALLLASVSADAAMTGATVTVHIGFVVEDLAPPMSALIAPIGMNGLGQPGSNEPVGTASVPGSLLVGNLGHIFYYKFSEGRIEIGINGEVGAGVGFCCAPPPPPPLNNFPKQPQFGFNGFGFRFSGADRITGSIIDSPGAGAINASPVTFTTDSEVFVNMWNSGITLGSPVVVTVTTVPLPASIWLFSSAALFLSAAGRKRSAKSMWPGAMFLRPNVVADRAVQGLTRLAADLPGSRNRSE
jgi:hypothetical protein